MKSSCAGRGLLVLVPSLKPAVAPSALVPRNLVLRSQPRAGPLPRWPLCALTAWAPSWLWSSSWPVFWSTSTDGPSTVKVDPSPFCALLHDGCCGCAMACADFHEKGRNDEIVREALCQICSNGLSHLVVAVIHQGEVYGYNESGPLVADGTSRRRHRPKRMPGVIGAEHALDEAFARIPRVSRGRMDGLLLMLDLLAVRIASTLAESPSRLQDRPAGDSAH